MEASDKKKANKLITQPFLGKEKSLKKKNKGAGYDIAGAQ